MIGVNSLKLTGLHISKCTCWTRINGIGYFWLLIKILFHYLVQNKMSQTSSIIHDMTWQGKTEWHYHDKYSPFRSNRIKYHQPKIKSLIILLWYFRLILSIYLLFIIIISVVKYRCFKDILYTFNLLIH